jgi:hypothetical protein
MTEDGMKYRKIIAAALCLAMVCSAGCSLRSKKGSESGTKISYSSTTKKYDLSAFSFELSDDFSVKDTRELSTDGSICRYEFSADGFTTFEVSCDTSTVCNCTAEVSAQDFYEYLMEKNGEKEKHSDIEKETIDVPGMDAAWVHTVSEYPDDGIKQGESELYITTEAHGFEILATYDDPGRRESVKALLKEIAASVKYTSNDRLPTEEQSYENDYFSFTCGPEWYIRDMNAKSKSTEKDNIDIQLTYYYAKDMEHYYYPRFSIGVTPEDDEYNVQIAAERSYESKKKSKLSSEVKRGTEEISGYTAETVSYVLDLSGNKGRYKSYFFSENGCVYVITESLNMRNEEGSRAELKAILDTLKIKKLSDEERAKRAQEHEAANYTEHSFNGAKFTLRSKFEVDNMYGDKIKFNYNYGDMDLIVGCYDKGRSFDDYVEDRIKSIRYANDVYILLTDNSRINGTLYVTTAYLDKSDLDSNNEPRTHSVYFLGRGDKVWEFEMCYKPDDKSKAIGYLEEMLGTITFE